jgi:hypothetical protein
MLLLIAALVLCALTLAVLPGVAFGFGMWIAQSGVQPESVGLFAILLTTAVVVMRRIRCF